MAFTLPDLAALTATTIADGDLTYVVDISAGTSGDKKMTALELATYVNGKQKSTGWAATYAGTATRTTFDTSTVTTAQLAERVKALLDDLIAKGLLAP